VSRENIKKILDTRRVKHVQPESTNIFSIIRTICEMHNTVWIVPLEKSLHRRVSHQSHVTGVSMESIRMHMAKRFAKTVRSENPKPTCILLRFFTNTHHHITALTVQQGRIQINLENGLVRNLGHSAAGQNLDVKYVSRESSNIHLELTHVPIVWLVNIMTNL
jgi:hypothetical protein